MPNRTVSLTVKGRQSSSVIRSQKPQEKKNNTLTFDPSLYPHITTRALDTYHNAAVNNTHESDPNQLWSRMHRSPDADYRFQRTESWAFKSMYLTIGGKGLTIEFLRGDIIANKFCNYVRNNHQSHYIDEQDPRHVGSHIRQLQFVHNHFYKNNNTRWSARELRLIINKAENYGLIGPKKDSNKNVINDGTAYLAADTVKQSLKRAFGI